MFNTIQEDISSVMERDPAARSRIEVALLYPGFHAILFYRFSHRLWIRGWKFLARLISSFGRFITGIEIHPAARIGRRFVIDHGSGVVIGETSEIGDDVTLYHAVTLGGISPSVNSSAQIEQKRHPTLRDGVIAGSGAQILGPITIGKKARIGANAVVLNDVAGGITVVGIPARAVASRKSARDDKFVAYGAPSGDISDPVARAIDGLLDRVATLSARIEDLEKNLDEKQKHISDVPYEEGKIDHSISKGEGQ